MNHNLALNLIYSQITINQGEGQYPGTYFKVLYFFSESSFVPVRDLEEVARALFSEPVALKLMFDDLEDLTRFAVGVCVHLESPEVFVLSSIDYNSGVEGTRDIRNFREIYRRFGHSLLNPQIKKEKASNFFSKFFKE
ncbi:MAG: hypothetical protein ACOYL6_01235 [Bacteriovoracaceae bacterium]